MRRASSLIIIINNANTINLLRGDIDLYRLSMLIIAAFIYSQTYFSGRPILTITSGKYHEKALLYAIS